MGVTAPWCWSEADRAQWMADQVRRRQAAGTVPNGIDGDAMAAALDALVDWIEVETDPEAGLKATFLAAVRELGPNERSRDFAGVSLPDVIHWRTTDRRFEGRMIRAVATWRASLPPMREPEPEPGRHGITPTYRAGCRCMACEEANHIATAASARLAELGGK